MEATGGGDGWPLTTSIWCWNCCHPFDSVPVPIPHMYDDRRNVLMSCGCFCSWSCAERHVLEGKDGEYSCTMLTLLRLKVLGGLGTQRMGIRAAPPRTALAVFGGKLSIEQFRKGFKVLYPENMLFPSQDVTVERIARPNWNASGGELGSKSKARISRMKPYVPSATYGKRVQNHADPGCKAAKERSAMQAIRGSQPVKNSTYKLSRAKPLQNSGDLFSALNDEW
jgi:hypothetical protein